MEKNQEIREQCPCGTVIEYDCLACQGQVDTEIMTCRACCHQSNAGDPDCPEEFR